MTSIADVISGGPSALGSFLRQSSQRRNQRAIDAEEEKRKREKHELEMALLKAELAKKISAGKEAEDKAKNAPLTDETYPVAKERFNVFSEQTNRPEVRRPGAMVNLPSPDAPLMYKGFQGPPTREQADSFYGRNPLGKTVTIPPEMSQPSIKQSPDDLMKISAYESQRQKEKEGYKIFFEDSKMKVDAAFNALMQTPKGREALVSFPQEYIKARIPKTAPEAMKEMMSVSKEALDIQKGRQALEKAKIDKQTAEIEKKTKAIAMNVALKHSLRFPVGIEHKDYFTWIQENGTEEDIKKAVELKRQELELKSKGLADLPAIDRVKEKMRQNIPLTEDDRAELIMSSPIHQKEFQKELELGKDISDTFTYKTRVDTAINGLKQKNPDIDFWTRTKAVAGKAGTALKLDWLAGWGNKEKLSVEEVENALGVVIQATSIQYFGKALTEQEIKNLHLRLPKATDMDKDVFIQTLDNFLKQVDVELVAKMNAGGRFLNKTELNEKDVEFIKKMYQLHLRKIRTRAKRLGLGE